MTSELYSCWVQHAGRHDLTHRWSTSITWHRRHCCCCCCCCRTLWCCDVVITPSRCHGYGRKPQSRTLPVARLISGAVTGSGCACGTVRSREPADSSGASVRLRRRLSLASSDQLYVLFTISSGLFASPCLLAKRTFSMVTSQPRLTDRPVQWRLYIIRWLWAAGTWTMLSWWCDDHERGCCD